MLTFFPSHADLRMNTKMFWCLTFSTEINAVQTFLSHTHTELNEHSTIWSRGTRTHSLHFDVNVPCGNENVLKILTEVLILFIINCMCFLYIFIVLFISVVFTIHCRALALCKIYKTWGVIYRTLLPWSVICLGRFIIQRCPSRLVAFSS